MESDYSVLYDLAERMQGSRDDGPSNYDQFFSFAEMGLREINNFLYDGSEPSEAKGIKLSSIESVLNYELGRLDLNPGLLKESLNSPRFQKETSGSGRFPAVFDSRVRSVLRSLARRCLYSALDKDLGANYNNEQGDQIEFAKKQIDPSKHGKLYYRGQSDYSWTIVPSMVRNLIIRDGRGAVYDGVCLNVGGFFHLYYENGYSDSLIKKYNKYYGPKPVLNPDDIDYRFLAWMQHTTEYSPLVDFTSDYCVAASFAVNAKNPNAFLDVDSAVYIYELPDGVDPIDDIRQIDGIVSKMEIAVTNKKIVPGSSVVAFDLHTGVGKIVSHMRYKEIVDNLVPKYAVIDIMPNDRMLRQKGKFILLYDYEIVNGKTFDKLEGLAKVKKHLIKANEKKELLEWLHEQHPEVDMPFLMNPYLDFDD